jgi:hypothetical protein
MTERLIKDELNTLAELVSGARRDYYERNNWPDPNGLLGSIQRANDALQVVGTIIAIDNARWQATVAEGEARRQRGLETTLNALLGEQVEQSAESGR